MSSARIIIPLIGAVVGLLAYYFLNNNEYEDSSPNVPNDQRRTRSDVPGNRDNLPRNRISEQNRRRDSSNRINCTICLESLNKLNPNLRISKLPCTHEFHSTCIQNWKRVINTCPVCRSPF